MIRKTQIMLWICLGLVLLNIGRFYLTNIEQPSTDSSALGIAKNLDHQADGVILFPNERAATQDARIVDKPLFEKNRQPFTVQAKILEIEPEEQKSVTNLTVVKSNPKIPELLGVLNMNTQTYAFFNVEGELPSVVTVGEEVNEWKIKQISTHEVTLIYQESEEILKIKWNQHISLVESDKLLLNDGDERVLEEQGSLKDRLSRIINQ